MNLHKITYFNGVVQYKNLIKHEDYLNIVKPIQNEIYELECKNYKKFKKQIIELKINKDQVSHIKIYDFTKKKCYTMRGLKSYEYFPDRKIKWLFGLIPIKTLKAGWYCEGSYYSPEEVENHNKYKGIIRGNLLIKPNIDIYRGDSLLKTKYFDSLEQAQKYCKGKFPNINIIFKYK